MNNYLAKICYSTSNPPISNPPNVSRYSILATAIFIIAATLIFSGQVSAQDPWRGVRPQVLTEQAFTDFVAIVKEFKEKKINITQPENATPEQEVASIANSEAAVALLEQYGYSPGEFVPMSVNVVIAHVIASSPESAESLDAEIQRLEAQKESMEQAQFEATMTALGQRLNFLKSAPTENLTLAAKFSDALNAMATEEAPQ